MKRRLLLTAAGLTFAIGAGCGHSSGPGATAAVTPSNTVSNKPEAGTSGLDLVLPPHPQQLDETSFQVTYTDESGKPVRGASIVLDLSMPEMAMPENKVACKETKPGTYEGSGHFTMAGHWKVVIVAKSPGKPAVSRSIDPVTVE